MAGESEKILIIVYYWPPSGGSGVQRWMYFARYISQFGYKPYVLTVDPGKASYRDIDQSNCEVVNGIKTYTTNTFELIRLYSLFTSGSKTKGIPQGHVGAKKHGLFGKISSFIRGNIFIPDARAGWRFYALPKAKEIIKKEGIAVIITSGPPHSTHLIGLKLKRKLNIKWIADFRDPWSEIYYNKELVRTKKAKRLDEKLEMAVLKESDLVLSIGPSMKKLLADKVPDQRGKFHYILNGYDHEAMEKATAFQDDYFKITFIGQFALAQPHEGMVRALEQFGEIHKEDIYRVKILLAGTFDELIVRRFKELNINAEYFGRIEHMEALKLMKSSQVLLNSLAEVDTSRILISGKLMEYISTGNPILCIGDPEGDAAWLLNSLQNSKMFVKEDIGGMTEFLSFTFNKWKSGALLTHQDLQYKQNSRLSTTGQLAELIRNTFYHV